LRIVLIDVDSKIPNLALMKLSAYHKARGDQVECPHEVREPAKATGQMKLFEEATL